MSLQDICTEIDALAPGRATGSGARRRTVLHAAVGLGYAAAAAPLMAQTAITTSAEGLDAGRVYYERDGFQVPAYRAKPAGKSGLPVVLVIQEIFGVHEYIADVCRRFAKAGYLAIAPDLYARQGDASKYSDISRLMADLVAKVPDAQVMGDLDSALAWAGENGGDTSRAGITGFCWGGRITWLYAAHGPVKAGVAWYGKLEGAPTRLTPKYPIELTPILRAPVLGLYGEADTGIPMASVERMRTALASGSPEAKASRIVTYPDAPHAFQADYRPSYREAAAKDGWQKALAWFGEHGVR